MTRVEFEPECVMVTVLLKKKKAGVTVGEEVSQSAPIWPQVEESGRVVSFGALVEEAIREAVEVAEEREAGG